MAPPRAARRVRTALTALFLAVASVLAPAAASPAAAATGRLLIAADATYTLDLAARAVHVRVDATFRNDRPSDGSFRYYWRELSWLVQPEASAIAVRDATGALAVRSVAREGVIEAEFRLRRDLLYDQAVALTITWDLPAGEPRSDSSIRIGAAFTAFELWAWGDPGASTVRAELPPGFDVETTGSAVETAKGPQGTTVSAAPAGDPGEFWVGVTAARDASLASDRLVLPGDIELLVRGWPEDTIWRSTVLGTLRSALPRLQALVGLPWPMIDRRVEVTEVYAPLLEGYAGLFYTVDQRIELSEDLDPAVTVHEAAHAWFNPSLFVDRWIGEGLAETYAANVLPAISATADAPDVPAPDDPGRIDLADWPKAERVTEETAARETYAYNAAWYVISRLFAEIGESGLRAVIRAADADEIAYRGAMPPETVERDDDWRRFLDLLEEVGGSTQAEALFREYVAADTLLDARAAARAAYTSLLRAGDGWLPPPYVREAMGAWDFDAATTRIVEADAVLDARAEIVDAAGALGLTPSDELEAAFETATESFAAAENRAARERDALVVIAAADDALEGSPDAIEAIGLLGADPDADYQAAAAAYEAGDLDAAEGAAGRAVDAMATASIEGGRRLVLGVGGGIVLLLGAVRLRSRQRRARVSIPAEAGALATHLADERFDADAVPDMWATPAPGMISEPLALNEPKSASVARAVSEAAEMTDAAPDAADADADHPEPER